MSRARQVVQWMTNNSTSRLSIRECPCGPTQHPLSCSAALAARQDLRTFLPHAGRMPAIGCSYFFSASAGNVSPRFLAAARVVTKMIGSPPAERGLITYTSLPSEFASFSILVRISRAGWSRSSSAERLVLGDSLQLQVGPQNDDFHADFG